MLTIPNQVKALFNKDSTRKNLRISFPNGEYRDLTCSDIVSESMRFRESACSRDNFSFGLAEASTIEFETVGVPNIIGCSITAALEVDASSLPADLQESRADVPFPFYSVSLGSFIVTSCPRNHEAMAHRQVTAISRLDDEHGHISPVMQAICSRVMECPTKSSAPRIYMNGDGILRLMGYDTTTPSSAAFTKYYDGRTEYASKTLRLDMSGSSWTLGYTNSGYVIPLQFKMKLRYYAWTRAKSSEGSDTLYTVKHDYTATEPDYAAAADAILAAYPTAVFKNTQSSDTMTATRQTIIEALKSLDSRARAFYSISNSDGGWSVCSIPDRLSEFYPVMTPTTSSTTTGLTFQLPVSLLDPAGTNTLLTYLESAGAEKFEVWGYRKTTSESDALDAVTMYVQADKMGQTDAGYPVFAFTESDFNTYILSVIELKGAIGVFRRDGTKDLIYLVTGSPIRYSRSMYESCWWDEYELEPVGSIEYIQNGKKQIYTFGDGASTYSMTNPLVSNRVSASGLLEAALVPTLENLKYTPVELTARGLPYVEAGDYIKIEAEDGTIVETYVLERELTGIQHLVDNIVADGVTIMEV